MKEREMEEMEEAVEEEEEEELEELESQFFHHYETKENIATANTMSLFMHLYCCDPNKFFSFLKELFKEEVEGFEPDSSSGPVVFELQKRNTEGAQEKGNFSVPDACISQDGFFKIVIETKLDGSKFSLKQLKNHLRSFVSEEHKILMTLAPARMSKKTQEEFESSPKLKEKAISHCNLTFSDLVLAMGKVASDASYRVEMSEVLEDYKRYCNLDDLNLLADPSRTMVVKWVSKTHEFNTTKNAYHNTDSDFRAKNDYLGLCIDGRIRFIGKFCAQVTIGEVKDTTIKNLTQTIKSELGKKKGKDDSIIEKCKRDIKEAVKKITLEKKGGDRLTSKRKGVIKNAIEELLIRGDESILRQHTYYFVDGFYETNYCRKIPRRGESFDLIKDLGLKEDDLSGGAKGIAEALKGKTWE